MSTTKHDSPRKPVGASPVRARRKPRSAIGPSDVHTFWPDTTQRPSACFLARARIAPRSEPASGSLKSWHQMVSAERIPGSRACWSGVPCSMSVGPTMLRPIVLTGSGAPASPQVTRNRAYSARVAPRPPYSAGQWTPIQPPSCSTRCQARRRSNASPSAPVGSASGSDLNSSVRCWSSQARSSSRKATSSGVVARSARSCTVSSGRCSRAPGSRAARAACTRPAG